MFLKNREFRIRVVNPKKDEDKTPPTLEEILNEDSQQLINEHMLNFVKKTAIVIGVTVAAVKVVDTLCTIAEKKTKSADSE